MRESGESKVELVMFTFLIVKVLAPAVALNSVKPPKAIVLVLI